MVVALGNYFVHIPSRFSLKLWKLNDKRHTFFLRFFFPYFYNMAEEANDINFAVNVGLA